MKRTYLSILITLAFLLPVSFASCNGTNENPWGEGETVDPDEEEEDPEDPGSSSDDGLIIVAYVTSWTSVMPDPESVTHINYSFGHVNTTYNGVTIDNESRLKKIVELKKQNASLKVLLSIGGWGSGRFSEMAANATNRKSFAADCKRIVDEFGLDGIDIDWEFPSSNAAGISSSPNDIANNNLLMEDIRSAIGKSKLLTFATAATASYYDFETLKDIVDYCNIMLYDIAYPPYHHSALYRSEQVSGTCGEESVKAHVDKGFPIEKLVLGVPFYGRGDTDNVPASITYANIVKLTGFTEKWDDVAKAPYLVNSDNKIVCVYDNPQSIIAKCQFVKTKKMKGIMFWDYSGDDPNGTLRKTIKEELNKE